MLGLTTPLALALLVAVPLAWWLGRRGDGTAQAHPLWFLVEPGRASRTRRTSVVHPRMLVVVAIALVAVAASGPVLSDRAGSRVLVVDLSLTRARDADAIRARLADYDEVVLARPAGAVRVRAADARAQIVGAGGTLPASQLADAVTLALPGARAIDVAAAPPLGDDAAIAAVRWYADPAAPARGRIVVELALHGRVAAPQVAIVRAGTVERARAAFARVADRAVAVIPYAGQGGERVSIGIDPVDDLPLDDVAVLDIPSLAPTPVWIDPALAGSPIARAASVLPTLSRVDAPADTAIAIVPSTAWRGPAAARIVVTALGDSRETAPLSAASGAPLPGITPSLLAATPPVEVDRDAGTAAREVWLRAGPYPAVWLEPGTLRIAARLDGAVVPILLADVIASHALDGHVARADVAHVADPAPAPRVEPPPSRTQHAPTRLLVVIAALLVAIAALWSRARGWRLALYAAITGGCVAIAALATTTAGRRVAFVVDVSASVAPVEQATREALARQVAALGDHDRAALIVVAGGARTVLPLGSPERIRVWATRAIEPTALGLDPARTDLGAGLALAAAALGPGGEIVLVGDGRDSVAGDRAIADSPARIGRRVELVPIDNGDLVRVGVPATSWRARPHETFALAVSIEARVATTVELAVAHRGRTLATRTLAVAAGSSTTSVPITLDDIGLAELDVSVQAGGDPIAVTDHAHAIVDVAVPNATRTLHVDATNLAAITPAALDELDAVILDDVAVSADATRALDDFVMRGGSLIWAAGPATAASGAGALEPLLPLQSTSTEPTAILLVVDRSGSLDAATRNAPVAGAAELAAAARTLGPDDWFGAITFDVAPTEWIPLTRRSASLVVADLPPARGGTDPTAALVDARRRLQAIAARRIAVLVSDGDFPSSAATARDAAVALARDGIRLEVIAAGVPDDRARALLAELATLGGGHVYDATLATALPALRTRPAATTETQARARAAWSGLFGGAPAALVTGVPVRTHVVRQPSADAIVLADAGSDPLFAVRTHGAGHVLAWTADLRGQWIDPGVADAALRSTPRPAATVEVAATSDPHEVQISVSTPVDVAAIGARLHTATGDHDILLSAAERGRAVGSARIAERCSVIAGGATAHVVPTDPEHAHLGVAPITTSPRASRESILVPVLWVWCALVIAALLFVITTRKNPMRATPTNA